MDKDNGDGCGKPSNEEDERLGVIAVKGKVKLSENGTTETNKTFEETKDDATALREVLDTSYQHTGVGKSLRKLD